MLCEFCKDFCLTVPIIVFSRVLTLLKYPDVAAEPPPSQLAPSTTAKMRLTVLPLLTLLLPLALGAEVTTEYTVKNECDRKTQRGDSIQVHYRGTLASDGTEFDASYNRGQPLAFTVGKGQVIKGWDEGLLDMCISDKRVLTIPPEFGYGERAMGPIPAGSTLGEFFRVGLWGVGADAVG